MTRTAQAGSFAEYGTRDLSCMGDCDPIHVQRATAATLERRGARTVAEFVRLEVAHDLDHLRQDDAILVARRGRRGGGAVHARTLQLFRVP